MLKSLSIKFYQSHRDTLLKFSPYLNIISGEPCSGKTAIIRAFTLLKENRPAGFRYNSWFSRGEPTEVAVVTSEDIRIKFSKSKKAEYQITGFEKPFHPGRNVPEQVGSILNFGEMNIQRQLDKTFIITDSPGKIAERLNKIIQMELADQWVSKLASRIRANVREQNHIKADRAISREQLRSLPNLKVVKEKIDAIKAMQEKADRLADKRDRLIEARRRLEDLQTQAEEIPIKEIEAIYKQIERKLKPLAMAQEIAALLRKLRKIDMKAGTYKREKREATARLNALYKRLKKCPTCGNELSQEQRETLIEGG